MDYQHGSTNTNYDDNIYSGVIFMSKPGGRLVWNYRLGAIFMHVDETARFRSLLIGTWLRFTCRKTPRGNEFVLYHDYIIDRWEKCEDSPYKTIADAPNEKVTIECDGIGRFSMGYNNQFCVDTPFGIVEDTSKHFEGYRQSLIDGPVPVNVRLRITKNDYEPLLVVELVERKTDRLEAVVIHCYNNDIIVSTRYGFAILEKYAVASANDWEFLIVGRCMMVVLSDEMDTVPRVLWYELRKDVLNRIVDVGQSCVTVECSARFTRLTQSENGFVNSFKPVDRPFIKEILDMGRLTPCQNTNAHHGVIVEIEYRMRITCEVTKPTTNNCRWRVKQIIGQRQAGNDNDNVNSRYAATSSPQERNRHGLAPVPAPLSPSDTIISEYDHERESLSLSSSRGDWENRTYPSSSTSDISFLTGYPLISSENNDLNFDLIQWKREEQSLDSDGSTKASVERYSNSISKYTSALNMNRWVRNFEIGPNYLYTKPLKLNDISKNVTIDVLVVEIKKRLRDYPFLTAKFWLPTWNIDNLHRCFVICPFAPRGRRPCPDYIPEPEYLRIGSWYSVRVTKLKPRRSNQLVVDRKAKFTEKEMDFPHPSDMDVDDATYGDDRYQMIQVRTKLVRRRKNPDLPHEIEILQSNTYDSVIYYTNSKNLCDMPKNAVECVYTGVIEPLAEAAHFGGISNIAWVLMDAPCEILPELTMYERKEERIRPLDWNEQTAKYLESARIAATAVPLSILQTMEKKRRAHKKKARELEDPSEVGDERIYKEDRIEQLSACIDFVRLNWSLIKNLMSADVLSKLVDVESLLKNPMQKSTKRIEETSAFLYNLIADKTTSAEILERSSEMFDAIRKTVAINETYLYNRRDVDRKRLNELARAAE